MKNFNGKAIYNPSGKAGEYSYWACNFYVGCSNGCEYCYCKKGMLAKVCGKNKPTLKKCFRDEDHALTVFRDELITNQREIRKHGLFFSFTTDPLLPETRELTYVAIQECMFYDIPVKVLTKRSDWVNFFDFPYFSGCQKEIAWGFTLTGCDNLELGASNNTSRIFAMRLLKGKGFRIFASIEPIVEFENSLSVIYRSIEACNLYKIGLMSGKKYDPKEIQAFIEDVMSIVPSITPVYFKDSLVKGAGLSRWDLRKWPNCVDSDFNIFQIIKY